MGRFDTEWAGEYPCWSEGRCPVCEQPALVLVQHSGGHREIYCTGACDAGDILGAVGLVAADLLEEVPLPAWMNPHEAKEIPLYDEWEAPIPLEEETRLPAFPVECLPAAAHDYALAIAEFAQVSVDMAAVALLAIVALCAQRVFRIQGKPGWVEQLSLFFAIFAPPAERKSSISDIVSRPVIRYEEHANELLQYEIDYYEAEREVIERP